MEDSFLGLSWSPFLWRPFGQGQSALVIKSTGDRERGKQELMLELQAEPKHSREAATGPSLVDSTTQAEQERGGDLAAACQEQAEGQGDRTPQVVSLGCRLP